MIASSCIGSGASGVHLQQRAGLGGVQVELGGGREEAPPLAIISCAAAPRPLGGRRRAEASLGAIGCHATMYIMMIVDS